ncbi:MAG: hypothetical protein O7F17_10155 [Planctomycetota bacterium]|nr:hypothetical protein [Planctomycetota bacterium]
MIQAATNIFPADVADPNDLLGEVASWPVATSAAPASHRCATPCPPDFDCIVGILDLLTLLANWGPCA